MIRQSRSRKRFLGPTGVAAVALAIAAPAYACTNYVGKLTIQGNGTSQTVANGLQCADDATTSGNTACTQAMTINDTTSAPDATVHAGGTLLITTGKADVNTTCQGSNPPTTAIGTKVCWLNDSSAIKYPTGPNTPFGYYVDEIQVGFSGHTNPMSPTAAQDCMHWNGNGSGFVTVATVTVSGGAGLLTGQAGVSPYHTYAMSGNTAKVDVPSGFPLNISGQQAGLCVSDSNGEDGIQVPFTIN